MFCYVDSHIAVILLPYPSTRTPPAVWLFLNCTADQSIRLMLRRLLLFCLHVFYTIYGKYVTHLQRSYFYRESDRFFDRPQWCISGMNFLTKCDGETYPWKKSSGRTGVIWIFDLSCSTSHRWRSGPVHVIIIYNLPVFRTSVTSSRTSVSPA